VLQVLGAIAFVCCSALAACMISLWMKREVRQVGIMKTIGARSFQLAWQYLALVGPLVLCATAIAVPVGILLSRWVVKYHQLMLNIDVSSWSAPRGLLFQEIVVSIAVPFLAMALPIVGAARMTARKAIQDPGIIAPKGPIALTSRIIAMPGNRQWTFALRNTFRRPWRLLLIVLSLSAGGALLMTAYNNYDSLMRVIDHALADRGHNLEVQVQKPATAAQLEDVAKAVPGVEIAEAFRSAGITVMPGGATESSQDALRLPLVGYPLGTRLLVLPPSEGRWPDHEPDAVVVNRHALSLIPNSALGSVITIRYRDRSSKVRIVGIVEEIGSPIVYASFPVFETLTGRGDAANSLRVRTVNEQEEGVAPALDQALLNAHLAPGVVTSKDEVRTSLEEHFAVVGGVMKMVALGAIIVGAISLIATVSLGVLERAREIGVIRAVGATPRAVLRIFLLEGSAVTLLSALFAIAGGILFAGILNGMAAKQLLHVAVPLYVSRTGLAILSGGGLLVVLGVWLSVSRILRMSVRDALAYE
jgi:putative ABC transport system permease protein